MEPAPLPFNTVCAYITAGPDSKREADILENYPGLSREDVAACLAYARDVLRSEEVYPSPA